MPPRRSHRAAAAASQTAVEEEDEANHENIDEDVTITNGSRSPHAR